MPQSSNNLNLVGGEFLYLLFFCLFFFFSPGIWLVIIVGRPVLFQSKEKYRVTSSQALLQCPHRDKWTGREHSLWQAGNLYSNLSVSVEIIRCIVCKVRSISCWLWTGLLLVQRCVGPKLSEWVQKWEGSVMSDCTPSSVKQANLSWHSGTPKIFVTSLHSFYLNISMNLKKQEPSALLTLMHSYLGAEDSKEVATCQHYVMQWWLILCLQSKLGFRIQYMLLGMPRLPPLH